VTLKRHAPAADRNRTAIADVLQRVLPGEGRMLEVASGSGQHVVTFAAQLPAWSFVPSDPDATARASVDAWVAESGLSNLERARDLDTRVGPWPDGPFDAVVAINMVHISPWAATTALLQGASRVLRPGGLLVLYGPYVIDGQTADSNRAFDASLRGRDPRWGVRELRTVLKAAGEHDLHEAERVAMPANNHCVILRLQ